MLHSHEILDMKRNPGSTQEFRVSSMSPPVAIPVLGIWSCYISEKSSRPCVGVCIHEQACVHMYVHSRGQP